MASEELEALKAIYCNHGELEVHQSGGTDAETIFSMQIKSEEDTSLTAQMTAVLPHSYPFAIGNFSINCDKISRDGSASIKCDIENFSRSLLGQPMLMDLILWLQSHLHEYKRDNAQVKLAIKQPEKHSEALWTYVCHLDHMRAKSHYVKTIQKWTDDLGLTGYLLFYDRWIFIVLEGYESQIKEYILRQKTISVDVDSKGRSCKERMFSVLAQEPNLDNRKKLDKFEVTELQLLKEIEELFANIRMKDIYENTIKKMISQR